MEKMYRITLSEEQLRLISNCLEDVSRFASGQVKLQYTIEQMVKGLPFDDQINRRDQAEELLGRVKKVLLPKMLTNESMAYNGTEFIGNTYQIYRTILHQLTVDSNINNTYSSPTLPSGNMGTIKVEKLPIEEKAICPCGSSKYYQEVYKDVTITYCSECHQKIKVK